mgnify:CR=1 FL=1
MWDGLLGFDLLWPVLSNHTQTNWTQVWNNTRFLHGAVGPYAYMIGYPALIGLLGSFYTISLYWYTRDITPPAVVITLFVGIFVLNVPAPFAIIAGLIVTIALAMAYWTIYRGGARQ